MLLRNSLWNVTGSALPAIAALASVPIVIGALGAEGYGIITIISSVVGYFAILDINLNDGAIKYLAESHAIDDRRRFAETFWFGAIFYGMLGLLGSLAIFFSADWLVSHLFKIPPASRHASSIALRIGAFGFLVSQMQSYLMVVPQSLQRFDRSAQSEAFFGVLVNAASIVAALSGGGVPAVIAARVGVSILNFAWLVVLVRRLKADLRFCLPGRDVRRSMTSFSAYSYLSKIATTLQENGDKLIIGMLAGPVALAFYNVPVTLAGRLLGLTYRISRVIYPRASALAISHRFRELRQIYLGATRYITYMNLMVLGMIVLAGDEFLRRWVGPQFITQGYPVLIIITTALLFDSLTNIPSLVNDALGHPRVTGRFALARGIAGVGLVFIGAKLAGAVGAAAAHLLSSIVTSLAFLIYVHGRTVPVSLSDTLRQGMGRSLGVGLLIFGMLFPLKWFVPANLLATAMIVALGAIALIAAGYAFVVRIEERAMLLAAARRLRS